MKNGDKGVFEPEFVPMYEFDLVTMKFVRIRKKGENLFDGGSTKMTTQFFQCSFIPVWVLSGILMQV